MTVQAYPLSWPQGWPRAADRMTTHPFGSRTYELSFDRARRQLSEEVGRLGACNSIDKQAARIITTQLRRRAALRAHEGGE